MCLDPISSIWEATGIGSIQVVLDITDLAKHEIDFGAAELKLIYQLCRGSWVMV